MSLTFLITAGPTREYLDPVRFLSNDSSGRIGYELACALLRLGHKVIFICGPANILPPKSARFISVTTAREMFYRTKRNFKKADIIISAAAVADYRPVKIKKHKIKKATGPPVIELARNPDILKYLGGRKKQKVLVGFALESKNLLKNAKAKLAAKNLDLIVANHPQAMGAKKASAWIINRTGTVTALKNKTKRELAKRIINETLKLWKAAKAYKKLS